MELHFADYTLNTSRSNLTRAGVPVHIEPKAYELLILLLNSKSEVVSKQDIVDKIWCGRATSDAAISSCVQSVRKSLSATPDVRKKIRSVYGRGFVFDIEAVKLSDEKTGPGSEQDMASFRKNPSFMVMPFRWFSLDSGERFIAECLCEEIYTSICRTNSLKVIARPTASALADKLMETDQIKEKTGVDYLLEGSVFESRGVFRVNVSLIDTSSNTCLWADCYGGTTENVFDIQREVCAGIVTSIIPSIQQNEIAKVQNKSPECLDAYENVLKALPHIWKCRKGDCLQAMELLERALALQPDYALAQALKSWCLAQGYIYAWGIRIDLKDIIRLSETALQSDSRDPVLLSVYGTAMTLVGRLESAKQAIDRALLIDRNSVWAWHRSGWIEGYLCEPEESMHAFSHAIELSPFDPMNFNCYFGMAQAHFIDENYEEALVWMEKALAERSGATFIHRLRAACHAHLGNRGEASKSIRILREDNADITASEIGNIVPFQKKQVTDRLVHGLAAAGMSH